MSNAPQLQRPRGQRDIKDLILAPQTQSVMKALVPKHMTPDRLMRVALIAIQKVPKLGECDATELLGAFLGLSALGLEANSPLQHAHLIPFENRRRNKTEVQVVIGYRGYLDLGRRSGLIRSIHADVVYPGDLFEYEFGTETVLRHKPNDFDGKPEDFTHAYCHVSLQDGQAFSVMPKTAVLRIRDKSEGYRMAVAAAKNNKPWVLEKNPWVANFDRMARKTAIRNLFSGGEVPLSLDMQNALAFDERKVDFASLAQASADDIRENLGGFVQEDDTAHDEDGVVIDQPAQVEDQRQEPAPQVQAQDDGREKDPAKPRGKKPAGDDDDTAALFNR